MQPRYAAVPVPTLCEDLGGQYIRIQLHVYAAQIVDSQSTLQVRRHVIKHA